MRQLTVAVLFTLMLLTIARNEVWADSTRLYEDIVSKAPEKARGHIILGTLYEQRGQIREARAQYFDAYEATILAPQTQNTGAVALSNLAATYMQFGGESGLDFADYLLQQARNRFETDRVVIVNSAKLFMNQGDPERALNLANAAIRYWKDVDHPDPLVAMVKADALSVMGECEQAADIRRKAHAADRLMQYEIVPCFPGR